MDAATQAPAHYECDPGCARGVRVGDRRGRSGHRRGHPGRRPRIAPRQPSRAPAHRRRRGPCSRPRCLASASAPRKRPAAKGCSSPASAEDSGSGGSLVVGERRGGLWVPGVGAALCGIVVGGRAAGCGAGVGAALCGIGVPCAVAARGIGVLPCTVAVVCTSAGTTTHGSCCCGSSTTRRTGTRGFVLLPGGARMLKRIVAAVALAAVVSAIVGIVSVAHASGCGRRLTLSIDGAPQSTCDARTADMFGSTRVHSYLFSALSLTGRVLTAAGTPSAYAPITVTSSVAGVVASTTTNSWGGYRIRVPVGPTRLLTVQTTGDSLAVEELVAPNVYLTAHAHPHATLFFYGHVTVSTAPPTVVLQDLAPVGWQTFGVATTNATGAYRYTYHSEPSTAGLRYAFRAITLPTPLWQPGSTGKHYATVRP